jgi:toxin-antitoxin system, toxin component, bro domain protein
MNTPIVYDYKGSKISFANGKNVMVNATEMAKSFDRRPAKWLELPSTKEFLAALTAIRKSDTALIQTNSGGINGGGGTWMHEDVALEFARWLSPAFAIWCNDRIKELLKYGMTATQPTLDEMVNNPDLVIRMATQLKQEREEKARLEIQNAQANERIALQDTQLKQQAPKVIEWDKYISSDGTFTTTQIAKEYGWGAKTLNNKLKERGIQYKQNGQWLLFAKYDGKGYTKSVPRIFTHKDGSTGTQMQTVWTSKGREFIHTILNAA